MRHCGLIAALTCFVVAATLARADSISNPGNGSSTGEWGPSPNDTFGEVFTVPTGDGTLLDFTLTAGTLDSSFPFVAQVYAWNGTGTTGSALYTSGTQTTPTTAFQLQSYTFDPNISVTAGAKYIALLTNDPSGTSLGGSGFGYLATGTAGSGAFLVSGNPQKSFGWVAAAGGSLEFNADFGTPTSAAPLPSTQYCGLALLGGLGLLTLTRSRKAGQAPPAAGDGRAIRWVG